MRRSLIAALLLAPALVAQEAAPAETPLSAAERRQAVQLLDQAQAAVAAALKLSPAQRAWKPAPDKWSVDECLEHITVTEDLISGLITKTLGGARTPASRADVKATDAEIIHGVEDRSRKFKAPEVISPTHRFKDAAALEAAYVKTHAALAELVKGSAADFRARTAPHPVLGVADAYQWVLLVGAHTLRHCAQIDEVKAAPGFPKA